MKTNTITINTNTTLSMKSMKSMKSGKYDRSTVPRSITKQIITSSRRANAHKLLDDVIDSYNLNIFQNKVILDIQSQKYIAVLVGDWIETLSL